MLCWRSKYLPEEADSEGLLYFSYFWQPSDPPRVESATRLRVLRDAVSQRARLRNPRDMAASRLAEGCSSDVRILNRTTRAPGRAESLVLACLLCLPASRMEILLDTNASIMLSHAPVLTARLWWSRRRQERGSLLLSLCCGTELSA